jgi:small-conductance mechanosensitive channel
MWRERARDRVGRRPADDGTMRHAAVAIVALSCATMMAAATRAAAQEPPPPDAEIDTAPVDVDGRMLFRVRGVSSLAADTRAERISTRIAEIARDRSVPVTALRVVEADGLAWVMAGARPVVAITEADARLEQIARAELAVAHLARVRQAIVDYREARRPEALRRGVRDATAAAGVFLLVAGAVVAIARWLRRLLERWARTRMASMGIESLAVMRVERVMGAIGQVLHLVTGIVLVVLTFEFLSFALGQFPNTRGLSNRLFDVILEPLTALGQAAVAQLPNLAVLAVLFFVFRVVLRVLRLVFDAVERGAIRPSGFEPEWAGPTYNIVRLVMIAFGVVVAYPYLPGSESAAFKGVSLFVGVLFSLGSTSAVADLIAGYLLIYRREFKVGDRIQIGDVIGDVTESRVQVTRLRSLKNEEVVLPNSLILRGQVTNFSAYARKDRLIFHTVVGIGYETPWRQVEAMLLAAAARTPDILRSPEPFVLQRALGDFAVNYELNVYCARADRMLEVYADLHRNIQDVFNEYGVQIMTPAYMADPSQPKVVPPAQWYAAPARPSADASALAIGPAAPPAR